MPIEYLCVRCVECGLYQAKQRTKANKFACVGCGAKQTIQLVLAVSNNGKDVGKHAADLNFKRGQAQDQKQELALTALERHEEAGDKASATRHHAGPVTDTHGQQGYPSTQAQAWGTSTQTQQWAASSQALDGAQWTQKGRAQPGYAPSWDEFVEVGGAEEEAGAVEEDEWEDGRFVTALNASSRGRGGRGRGGGRRGGAGRSHRGRGGRGRRGAAEEEVQAGDVGVSVMDGADRGISGWGPGPGARGMGSAGGWRGAGGAGGSTCGNRANASRVGHVGFQIVHAQVISHQGQVGASLGKRGREEGVGHVGSKGEQEAGSRYDLGQPQQPSILQPSVLQASGVQPHPALKQRPQHVHQPPHSSTASGCAPAAAAAAGSQGQGRWEPGRDRPPLQLTQPAAQPYTVAAGTQWQRPAGAGMGGLAWDPPQHQNQQPTTWQQQQQQQGACGAPPGQPSVATLPLVQGVGGWGVNQTWQQPLGCVPTSAQPQHPSIPGQRSQAAAQSQWGATGVGHGSNPCRAAWQAQVPTHPAVSAPASARSTPVCCPTSEQPALHYAGFEANGRGSMCAQAGIQAAGTSSQVQHRGGGDRVGMGEGGGGGWGDFLEREEEGGRDDGDEVACDPRFVTAL